MGNHFRDTLKYFRKYLINLIKTSNEVESVRIQCTSDTVAWARVKISCLPNLGLTTLLIPEFQNFETAFNIVLQSSSYCTSDFKVGSTSKSYISTKLPANVPFNVL